MYTREVLRYKGFFFYMPGQEWMFGLTEAPFVVHTATTVISGPSALNNTVGFCIDAGDLDSGF
jgi:hypothetical protein